MAELFGCDVVKVDERAGFKLVDIKSDKMIQPLRMIKTTCVGKCARPYCIDENHPDYQKILVALEAGDRSLIYCYHRGFELRR